MVRPEIQGSGIPLSLNMVRRLMAIGEITRCALRFRVQVSPYP